MNDFDPNHIPTKTFARIGQKAIIANDENKILLLLRSHKIDHGGKWSLAGGALEDREDPIDGIRREIDEETQLEVTDIRPFSLFSYTNTDAEFIVMVGYQCVAKNEKVILNWEHDKYKWVTKDEALQMDLSDHARFFIERIEVKVP
jgi:8-oxo-dGTP diphosphatase